MSTVMLERRHAGWLTQVLWFLLVGWWATFFWVIIAWLLCALIVTLPLGILMLNQVPKVLALREPGDARQISVMTASGKVVDPQQQRKFFMRTFGFLWMGFWLSAVSIMVAYIIGLLMLGLPVGFWLFDRILPF